MKTQSSRQPLTGKKVILEPFSAKHVTDTYVQWMNDPVVCRDNRHGSGYTIEKAHDYLKQVEHNPKDHVFGVHLKDSGKHVGNCRIGIAPANNSGEIALILGDRSVWGQGLGFEICSILLDYGLRQLKLHRIMMGMTARNTAMIKIAEKLGMKQEGFFKDALRKDGQYLDIVQYALINSEEN